MFHDITSHVYIIMIIVDSCMIWFHFDCIIQLTKKYIATTVCSRKLLLLLVISLTANREQNVLCV